MILIFQGIRLIWNGDDVAKRIFKQYPYPDPKPKDYRDWFSEIGTDFVIECPSRNLSNIFAAQGLDVYRYAPLPCRSPGTWRTRMVPPLACNSHHTITLLSLAYAVCCCVACHDLLPKVQLQPRVAGPGAVGAEHDVL